MAPAINFNPSGAFAPFFGDAIAVSGRRRTNDEVYKMEGRFSACVLENSLGGGIGDGDVDSLVRTFSISVRAGDWIGGGKPQIGDRVELESGVKVTVSSIDTLGGGEWTVSAREVK